MKLYIALFLAFCIGFVCSLIIMTILVCKIKHNSTFGEFQIDATDPDKDIYRIVYTKNPEKIKNHQWIVFDITKGFDFSEDPRKIQRL